MIGVPARARLTLLVLAAAMACLGHTGCVRPEAVSLDNPRLNPTLRRDREPLDPSQRQIAGSAAAVAGLAFGPYRPGTDELASPVVPIDRVPVRNLVQSDCWWSGRTPGDALVADPLRLHWEGVVDLGGAAPSLWRDDEDGLLDVGACRIDDPETRQPLRNADGRDEAVTSDCAEFNGARVRTLSPASASPDCSEDIALFSMRLDAYTPALDAYNQCTDSLLPDPADPTQPLRDRRIAQLGLGANTDAFSGAVMPVETDGRVDHFVSGCSAAEGYSIAPIRHTRYRLDVLGAPHWLGPALLVADHGMRLARPLARAGSGARVQWRTEVAPPVSGLVRWRENFASRVRVDRVRVFDAANGTARDFQPAPAPLLCIVDPEASTGSACRWWCRDADPQDGRLEYDLLGANACARDPANPVNSAEVPHVTPTYARDTIEAAALGSIEEPLRWQLDLAAALAALPMLEFTLGIPRDGAALMAEKPALDFGGVAPGTGLRAEVTVRNLGGSPARVVALRMEAGAHAQDFLPELPSAASPVPLPLLVDLSVPRKARTTALGGIESQRLFTVEQRTAHLRYAPTQGGASMTHDGVTLELRDGIWFRPAGAPPFVQKAPGPATHAPVARMSYVPRRMPFRLAPGEGLELSIIARPRAAGRRNARVLLDYEDLRQPGQLATIAVSLSAQGLLGPLPQAYPSQLNLAAGRAGWGAPHSVLLVNNGDQPFELRSAQVTGIGGAALSLPFRVEVPDGVPGTIGVGASTLLRVQYLAACDAHSGGRIGRSAELRLQTRDARATQWLVVGVRGASLWCP